MSRTELSRTFSSRTVVLVGMMGSGKTTVGRQVASALAMRFIDTDDAVVAIAGKAVRDIFAQDVKDRCSQEC